MKAIGTARGQPLVAMVFVVVAWIAVRMMMWEAGVEPSLPALAKPTEPVRVVEAPDAGPAPRKASAPSLLVSPPRPREEIPVEAVRVPMKPSWPQAPAMASASSASVSSASAPSASAPSTSLEASQTIGRSAPVPEPEPTPPPLPSRVSQSRWSGDGWLLARQGGGRALGNGAAPATYGASQAGAVLRYRLAPGDPHRAAAYARATAALNGSREKELALGVSARPLASLPVIAAAEVRASDQAGGTRLRPAAMLVSEVPPIALPKGLRAEVYGQAGYVGGRYATVFADGQLRVDRGVATVGGGELRAGAGAWGGAQKGVSRADIGPGATLTVPLGDSAAARLALDWRLRVAGHAAPASGPTLTLSAGF